jgi:hypothetical protein
MGLIDIFSLLVEVEVVLALRVASFFVPVPDKGFGLEFAGVVGGLLNYEVTVHFQSYNIY